jgi:hypothetical protein
MMRLISNLRLRLALLVCPDLRVSVPASGYADIDLARSFVPARWLRQASQMAKGHRADTPILPLADVLAERRKNRVSPGSVGPCRGGSRPDHGAAQPATGQGVPRRSVWQRLKALNDRIEDCWIGDLIGVAALAVLLVAMSFIVGML